MLHGYAMKFPPDNQYLTRDEFRNFALQRSKNLCIVPNCNKLASEVHHIIERRLWTGDGYEGGYFLGNAAPVCNPHHLECEQTIISCDQLRNWAGIEKAIYPPSLEAPTDKWGNPILENGQRGIGPLFYDESVQKVLGSAGLLKQQIFKMRARYGRTPHLPWSLGVTKTHGEPDDIVLESAPFKNGQEIVLSEKLDGENTSFYYGDGNVHARSIDGRSHPSRSFVKALHSRIAWDIPQNMRIVGENMQAIHSLRYRNIPPFLVFAIFESTPDGWLCLSWDETEEWCTLLDLPTVPVLHRGPWNEKRIRAAYDWRENDVPTSVYGPEREGYVVRNSGRFMEKDFLHNIAKAVRPNHVRSDRHWMHKQIEQNELLIS